MEAHDQRVTRAWRFETFIVSEGQQYPVEVELEKVAEEGNSNEPEVKRVRMRYLVK
jgi:hypothetical protein